MTSGTSKKIINLSRHSFTDIDTSHEKKSRKFSNINTQAVIYSNEKFQQLYTGLYLDENLHNAGTYRWLTDNVSHKYEGKLFLNTLHGYGTLSYPNQTLYEGLFYFNKKLGPGVITYKNRTQDVGIWNGKYLIRLCSKYSFSDYYNEYIPKLSGFLQSKLYLLQFKHLIPISEKFKDPAKDLLEKLGAPDTVLANKSALYSKLVRNPNSMFIDGEKLYKNFFTYEDELYTTIDVIDHYDEAGLPVVVKLEVTNLVAWNNEEIYAVILRHAFLNRHYEKLLSYKVKDVLCANKRGNFLPPGPIETRSEALLLACGSGDPKAISCLITDNDLYPDVADCRGNNTVTYATLANQTKNIQVLSGFGANLNSFNDDCVTPLLFALLQYIATKHDIISTLWEDAFIYAKAENYLPACNQQWPAPSATSLSENSQKSGGQLSATSRPSDPQINIEDRLNNEMTANQERRPSLTSLVKEYMFPLECIRKRLNNNRKTIDQNTKFKKSVINTSDVDVTFDQYKNEEIKKITQTMSTLLLCGANPNIGEVPFCPIITSIFTKSKDVIQMLISFNADVNAKTCAHLGSLGPLHVIGSLRPCVMQLEMAYIFLENGANVDDLANKIHWLEEQSVLLADKEPEDLLEKTPLHLVCMRYDFVEDINSYLIKLALMFLQYGANLNLKYLGHTPLTLAMMRGNFTLMETLLETGLVDPNESLGYNMGVPLTMCVLNRYSKILNNSMVKQLYSILERFYANPFNDVQDFNGNAIEFYYNEQKLRRSSRKHSFSKSNNGVLLLEYAKNILLRYVESKATQTLYHYKAICNFDSPLYNALVKYLNYTRTLEVLQMLIDHDKIIVNDSNMRKLLQLVAKKEPIENITFVKLDSYYPKFHFDNFMPETDPDESKYKVCFQCFRKTNQMLILCPKCELVYFCSQECNTKNSKDPNSGHPCEGVFFDSEKRFQSGKRRSTKLEQLVSKSIKLQTLLSFSNVGIEEFGKMDSKDKKRSIVQSKKKRQEYKLAGAEKNTEESERTTAQERGTKEKKSRDGTGKTEASDTSEKKKGKGDKPEETSRINLKSVESKLKESVDPNAEKNEPKLKESSKALGKNEDEPEDKIQKNNLKSKQNEDTQSLVLSMQEAECIDEETTEIDLTKRKRRSQSRSVKFSEAGSLTDTRVLNEGKSSKKTRDKRATKEHDDDDDDDEDLPLKKKTVKGGKQNKHSKASSEKEQSQKESKSARSEKQKSPKESRSPSPEKQKSRTRSKISDKQKSRSTSAGKQKSRKGSARTSTDFGENAYGKVNIVHLKKNVLRGASPDKHGLSIFIGSKKPKIDIEKRNMYCKLREQMLQRDRELNARKAAQSEYLSEKFRMDNNCTKRMLELAKKRMPHLTKDFKELDVKFWQMFSPYCIFQNGQLYYNFNEENNDVYYKLNYSTV